MYRAARFGGKNRTFEGKRFDIWIYPASCGTRLRGGPTYQASEIIFPAKSCFFLKHSIFLQIAGPEGEIFLRSNPENSNRPQSPCFGGFRRVLAAFGDPSNLLSKSLFAGEFFDAQFADAVAGGVGDFRPGVNEVFALPFWPSIARVRLSFRTKYRYAPRPSAVAARIFRTPSCAKKTYKTSSPRALWFRASSWCASSTRAACIRGRFQCQVVARVQYIPVERFQKTGRLVDISPRRRLIPAADSRFLLKKCLKTLDKPND